MRATRPPSRTFSTPPDGRREIIGLAVGAAETEVFWREFLRSLVARDRQVFEWRHGRDEADR